MSALFGNYYGVENYYKIDPNSVTTPTQALECGKNTNDYAKKHRALAKYFSDIIHKTFITAGFFVCALSLCGIVGAIFIPGAIEFAVGSIFFVVFTASVLAFHDKDQSKVHEKKADYFDNLTITFNNRAARL